MDGRDIGSIVFPDAGLKLFITADIEKRAERRFKEFSHKGYDVNLNDILMNIKKEIMMIQSVNLILSSLLKMLF